MDLLHHIVVKWGLALLYIATCLLLVLLFPPLIRPWLLLLFLVFLAWTFWNYEDQAGWEMDLRPLTPWDVADWARFRIRVSDACREAGLSREPYLAVMESPFPNAMAIGGRRGMIVYTTAALRALGQEELLAVTGHELAHLAAGDAWPTMVGGAWLRLIGWLCGLLYNFGSRGGGLLFLAARAGAVGLDVALRVVSWLAGISFAKRSRHQEYAADLLGARVTSNSAMCGALLRLEEVARGVLGKPEEHRPWSAAWIGRRLQASHPDTAARIARLETAAAQGGDFHAG